MKYNRLVPPFHNTTIKKAPVVRIEALRLSVLRIMLLSKGWLRSHIFGNHYLLNR